MSRSLSGIWSRGMTRSSINRHTAHAVLGATSVACSAGVGYAIVRKPGLTVLAAGWTVSLLCPPWLLLGGAIVAQHLLPTQQVLGVLLVSDLLLIAFVARWVVVGVTSREWDLPTGAGLWIVAFGVWAWLSMFATGSWQTASALERVTLYVLVFIAATAQPGLARRVFVIVALYATAESILALVHVTPQVEGSRLVGWYGDPGVLGALIAAGVAATMLLHRSARLAMLAVLLPAAFLTYTRATWVAVIVELAVIAFPFVRRRWVLLGGVIVAVVVAAAWVAPLITQRFELNPQSLPMRLSSWSRAVELTRSAPWFGQGWNVGGQFGVGQNPYNLWLNVAASTGILGALLITLALAIMVRDLARTSLPTAQAGLAFLAGFLVLSVQSMTFRAAGTVTIMFVALIGACLADAHRPVQRIDRDVPSAGHASRFAVTPAPRERRLG
jgi:O-Antigen ligase